MSFEKLYECIDKFSSFKPDIVISHDCPFSIKTLLLNKPHYEPTRTCQALDAMLLTHRPKKWIFGHHHTSISKTIDGTLFICLNELEMLKL
jgi:predicted phosphodiesterase